MLRIFLGGREQFENESCLQQLVIHGLTLHLDYHLFFLLALQVPTRLTLPV